MSKKYIDILSVRRSDGKIFKQGNKIKWDEDGPKTGVIFDFNITPEGCVAITKDGDSIAISAIEINKAK